MGSTSILKQMGTKATDYMHGLKALTPDASDIAGLRESQKNVANNTPTTPPPAPATPATVYPQDKLHPSENYKYGNQGGQKRLDMEGNIIPVPAYDSGRDVRVISPMIYDEGGEVDPAIAAGRAGQAQGNSMVQSLMAEPDVQAPDQAALNMPKPVKPAAKLAAKPAPASGSVGGVRDQQLDAPQWMQPTHAQQMSRMPEVAAPSQDSVMTGQPASALPQMNDAVPVMDCGGNVGIQAYDDGGAVNVNDGQHQLAILKHGEKVLNPREADAYRAGQQAAAAQAAPPAEGASPEGAQPDAQAAPVEGQPAEGMPQEKPEAATADPHIAQAAAKHYGLEEQPEEPVVKGTAAERKAINVDKKQAMGTGNLVKLGTALLNERHLSPMPTELKVYDDGGYVAPTLTPEQIEQQKLNARLADQNDTRGPQPTAKTTPSVVSENTVSARPQMTSGNLEQGAAPPDNFNHGNGGLTGRSMEEGATAPSALKPAGLKPMVAPEQAAAPAIGLPQMPLQSRDMGSQTGPANRGVLNPAVAPEAKAPPAMNPKEAYKTKLKAYDTQIQANLDLATPEGKEAADRLTLAKASYEKNNPWGSAANHPGFLGKLGHVAAQIGNTAGNIVAPGVMAEIPGTEMNRAERNANTRAQINEDTALETKATPKAVKPNEAVYAAHIAAGETPDQALAASEVKPTVPVKEDVPENRLADANMALQKAQGSGDPKAIADAQGKVKALTDAINAKTGAGAAAPATPEDVTDYKTRVGTALAGMPDGTAKNAALKTYSAAPTGVSKAELDKRLSEATNVRTLSDKEAETQVNNRAREDAAADRKKEAAGHVYDKYNTQLEKVKTPADATGARAGLLIRNLDLKNKQADSVVAPELLTLAAGGQGSGMRMNDAEIRRIVGGASAWDRLVAKANQLQESGGTFDDTQRAQIRQLATFIAERSAATSSVLDKTRANMLAGAEDEAAVRKAYNDGNRVASEIQQRGIVSKGGVFSPGDYVMLDGQVMIVGQDKKGKPVLPQ